MPAELIPFSKFNEKFNGYLFVFGQQNLRRIYDALGPVKVAAGQERIERLKHQLRSYKDMQQAAMQIKYGETYPEVPLKVSPLGEYQARGVAYLCAVERAPLFASCGVGKTYMSLCSTAQHIKTGAILPGKTLILGKLATLETGWLEDCERFTDLKMVNLWIKQTSKRKEKMIKKLDEPADVYLANHETIFILKDELKARQFQKIIVDESTVLKSYRGDFAQKGGKFGKALMEISEFATWRVIMSGTPAPNGPEELWGQFKFLDPEGFTLEPSYDNFKHRYMDYVTFGSNMDMKKWYCKEDSKPILKSFIDPLVYQVKIRDHLHDLPERTIMRRRVYMSPSQQHHYEEMLKNMGTFINGSLVSVDIILSELIKLRQITGGFLRDMENNEHPIDEVATKLLAMDDLMEEIGDEKIVVFAQYQWEIKQIYERYKDLGTVTVYGRNSATTNLANIKQFREDPNTKLIILHPRSAAHGITLTVSHYMIFYSISYSAEENYQCIARIERASQRHPMFVYYLIAKEIDELPWDLDTIDDIIYRVIQAKQRAQDKLLDQTEINESIVDEFLKAYKSKKKS